MKHEITTLKPPFTPVTLTLTIENQSELDALTCLANAFQIWEPTARVFDIDPRLFPCYDKLQAVGGDTSRTAEVQQAIKLALARHDFTT